MHAHNTFRRLTLCSAAFGLLASHAFAQMNPIDPASTVVAVVEPKSDVFWKYPIKITLVGKTAFCIEGSDSDPGGLHTCRLIDTATGYYRYKYERLFSKEPEHDPTVKVGSNNVPLHGKNKLLDLGDKDLTAVFLDCQQGKVTADDGINNLQSKKGNRIFWGANASVPDFTIVLSSPRTMERLCNEGVVSYSSGLMCKSVVKPPPPSVISYTVKSTSPNCTGSAQFSIKVD